MDETGGTTRNGSTAPAAADRPLPLTDIASWRAALARLDRDVSDAERIDQLRVLEDLKSAVCAAQARVAVDLDASQQQAQASDGVPLARRGQGIGAQVALARRESPHRGGQLLGLAKALVVEMPHTYRALQTGALNEWRATLLVRESACLSVVDRAAFDAELAADPRAFDGVGDRALVARAKKVAYRLDAGSLVRRARKAESERGVSLRPAPDTMSYLTGLLPVAQGVAVLAALQRMADAARAQGDQRTRGQLMADTLVERVTGQGSADAVPVEVQIVMTDRALLAGDGEPAHLQGYGTVAAQWARELVARRLAGLDGEDADCVGLWARRLFTHPTTGQLVAMDSRRRTVPRGLARFITARDRLCRSPWCDAPIRHVDHVVPAADGGPTSAENLQGYCEACNYAKQAPGWRSQTLTGAARALGGAETLSGAAQPPSGAARAGPAARGARAGPDDEGATAGHLVETTTPTGHRYTSQAPALPGRVNGGGAPEERRRVRRRRRRLRRQRRYSPAERYLASVVAS